MTTTSVYELPQTDALAGVEIRTKRELAKVSLRQLAKRLAVSAPYLCDLEKGRRKWSNDRFNAAHALLDAQP